MPRPKNRQIYINKRVFKTLIFGVFFLAAGLLASRSYAAQPPIELKIGTHQQMTLVREHGLLAKLRVLPQYMYCFSGEGTAFTTPSAPFIDTKAESKNKRCIVSRVQRMQDVDLELSGISQIDVVIKPKEQSN